MAFAFALSLLLAPAASAGWAPSRVVAAGINPILSIGSSGTAAIVTTGLDDRSGPVGAVRLTLAPHGGSFSPARRLAPVIYTPVDAGDCGHAQPPAPPCAVGPTGVTISTGDSVEVLYAETDQNFGSPPAVLQVIHRDGRSSTATLVSAKESGVINQGALLTTVRGEVIAAASPIPPSADVDAYRAGVLEPGSTGLVTQLVSGFGDVGLNHPDLATDDAGGTFLFPAAATVPDCMVVAYRPAHGRFRVNYGSSPCYHHSRLNQDPVGLGVSGNGFAALLSRSATSMDSPYALTLQLGRFGHFNRTVLIDPDGQDAFPPFSQGHAPIGGVSADADGALTLGWWECASLSGCSINAATADMDGRTYPRSVLAPSAIQLRVADGALAWESCGSHHGCRVDTDPVLAGHRFATPERVGTGELVALKDDHHGDSLVVWDAPGGRVRVALRTAGSARFGPARTLSTPGVDASTITAAYAHDGEAVIAWSAAGETHAALYVPGTRPQPPAGIRGSRQPHSPGRG